MKNTPNFSSKFLNIDISSASTVATIVFIDSSLEDVATLQAHLPQDARVHLLSHDTNILSQMSHAMSNLQGIKALHLFTHGRSGEILLGTNGISLETLPLYGKELLSISNAMKSEGEFFIYGCEVAAGERGAAFVKMLGDLTGLKVAAATHKVGHEELGGSWELDVASVMMSGALHVSEYKGVLAPVPGDDTITVTNLGNLTNPVLLNGEYYYMVNSNMYHDELDAFFNNDSDTTVTDRTAIVGGLSLSLATASELSSLIPSWEENPPSGWALILWAADSDGDNRHKFYNYEDITSDFDSDRSLPFVVKVAIAPPDTTAPTYTSAAITDANTIVTLTYNETVMSNVTDATALKAAVTFAADGETFSELGSSDTVEIVNGKLVVTFNSALTGSTSEIKVATGTLKDAADNVLNSEVNTAAITAADITAPVVYSATVNGTNLVLTYTEATTLDADNKPEASAFSVSDNTVESVSVDADAKTVTLTLGTAVVHGATGITVSYIAPDVDNSSTNAAIQDAAGNDAAALTAQEVTNNTLPPAPGDATITVAGLGDLIKPVLYDGAYYYILDENSNGTTMYTNGMGWYYEDYVNHTTLDMFFNNDADTTETDRTVTVNGLSLSLVTVGELASLTENGSHHPVEWVEHNRYVFNYKNMGTANLGSETDNHSALYITDLTYNISNLSDNEPLAVVVKVAIAPPDTTAPTYTSAAISGANKIVTLTYDETVISNVTADALKAAVTFAADGENFSELGSTDSVEIVNGKLVVTFNSALTGSTSEIKVATGTLKDAADNVLNSEVNTAAITAADIAAPVFDSATVNGTSLVLTYTEDTTLHTVNRYAKDYFAVSDNTVESVLVDTTAKTVTLTLGTAVVYGAVVTVSYTEPTADNDDAAIQDAAGNNAATITEQEVTNNTPQPAPGDATITVAGLGDLIKPVLYDGAYYYILDVDRDGVLLGSAGPSSYDHDDEISHNALDTFFNGGSDTTTTARTVTVDGLSLSLITEDELYYMIAYGTNFNQPAEWVESDQNFLSISGGGYGLRI